MTTITTAAELDALPAGTVIRTRQGDDDPVVYEKDHGYCWWATGSSSPRLAEDLGTDGDLPATVIYSPETYWCCKTCISDALETSFRDWQRRVRADQDVPETEYEAMAQAMVPLLRSAETATVKPSVSQVAEVIENAGWHAGEGHVMDFFAAARAVLTLLPGRTEAEVIAGALEGYRITRAVQDVALERATHASRGWTAEHDRIHGAHHLVKLAERYANTPAQDEGGNSIYSRAGLVKAASLVVAAIDLLDRVEQEG